MMNCDHFVFAAGKMDEEYEALRKHVKEIISEFQIGPGVVSTGQTLPELLHDIPSNRISKKSNEKYSLKRSLPLPPSSPPKASHPLKLSCRSSQSHRAGASHRHLRLPPTHGGGIGVLRAARRRRPQKVKEEEAQTPQDL